MLALRTGLALAGPLLAALSLTTPAAAQLRVHAEPFIQIDSGQLERAVVIDGGAGHAGDTFLAVPIVDGAPSRAIAGHLDRIRGRLDGSGRAVVQLRLPRPDRLSAQTASAIRQGVSLRVLTRSSIATLNAAPTAPLATAASIASGGLPVGTLPDFGSVSVLQLVTPWPGATVSSPSIDVRGRLSGPFNAAGTTVTVNGTAAEVFPSPTGPGRFVLRNVELVSGSNAIDVVATPPSGPSASTSTSVTLQRSAASNVVIEGGHAYSAGGPAGLSVTDLFTRESIRVLPPAGSDRVDDISVADGFLFLMDGANGGALSVMSLADPALPTLVSGPIPVPVGPFSGVSARGGRVVVSGGTSRLTVRSYGPDGMLSASSATIDLGIGQPDVLLSEDGTRAFVSTDFAGAVGGAGFGVTTLNLFAPPAAPTIASRTGIPGAGFTAGFQGPANFPIESALVNGQLVTAHGGGLSRISAGGALLGTTSLGFPAVNVDDAGDRVFVVGAGRSLAEVDLTQPGAPAIVSSQTFPGPGVFSGVAADDAHVVIASNAGGLRVLSR